MDGERPGNGGRMLAYAISALTTLLWVGCVLPSGRLAVDAIEDLATPMHRESWLLVPALLLLVVGPVGFILSRTRVGLLAVLSATDAFIAIYSALLLTLWGALQGTTSVAFVGLLYGLGVLSILETIRLLAAGPDGYVSSRWKGLRLAICLLVLLTPATLLVQDGLELASLLAPYVLLAVSTAGAVLTRTAHGLRLTAAILLLALSIHVVVTLRYTIFESDTPRRPAFEALNPLGWTTMGIAILLFLLALLQVLLLVRRVRAARLAAAPAEVVA